MDKTIFTIKIGIYMVKNKHETPMGSIVFIFAVICYDTAIKLIKTTCLKSNQT